MELARFFGFLHPAIVHFPLVLLIVSVGMEAIGFFRRDARFTWAAQVTLLLGTVGTLFAFVAGNFAEIWAARDGVPQDPMEFHELLATITSWSFVFLTAVRLFLGVGANRRAMAAYLFAASAACILLGYTGHRGAMLVYQHGAGVNVAGIQVTATHEDLAILQQKQTLDALFYSDMMHHVFGWMVLILSGMLLADMISPSTGEKLRRLAPLLLLAGGVFLMIFSDQDAWPLYHIRPFRPITDKEVLMHKTYAVLMLVVGVRGLWRHGGKQAISRRMQSRMMAIFALVGGALLFTHVHSNAPYANVAAGVYIHHTVMGFIALMIGGVKLMEDILQQKPQGISSAGEKRSLAKLTLALAWIYPCLMLTESIFLINYNEGLPWFLGYRDLSLAAPHGGLVAPLGLQRRAELCFDPVAQRFDLYLYGQGNNVAAPLAARSVQAVVKTGSDSTAIGLTPVEGDAAHYTGQATFLHDVSMFQTMAMVWPSGRPASIAPMTADFEPWIDAAAAKPHTHLAYICPMHDTVGSDRPGVCPLCRMALVPNRGLRPAGTLHDPGYTMDLKLETASSSGLSLPVRLASTRPVLAGNWHRRNQTDLADNVSGIVGSAEYTDVAEAVANRPIHLVLTPRRADGTVVRDLTVVHTKKLHLIVVSQDLSFFDHVHPIQQENGSLVLDYTFPHPGRYLLYADLTPAGDRNQVFRLQVTVAGGAPPDTPLIVTPALGKEFGDYRVQVAMNPDPPAVNDETAFTFTLYRDGLPVTDLEPYLGAGGHCVILSADTQSYLHSHPTEMGGDRYGPEVTFHARFMRHGIYKMWAQFMHHGQLLTTDFTLEVK